MNKSSVSSLQGKQLMHSCLKSVICSLPSAIVITAIKDKSVLLCTYKAVKVCKANTFRFSFIVFAVCARVLSGNLQASPINCVLLHFSPRYRAVFIRDDSPSQPRKVGADRWGDCERETDEGGDRVTEMGRVRAAKCFGILNAYRRKAFRFYYCGAIQR